MPAPDRLSSLSLRDRLIASYALVVLVTLLGLLAAFSVLFPSYLARQADARLADIARPTWRILTEMAVRNAPLEETHAVLAEQAENTGLRMIILTRADGVIADTNQPDNLVGRPLGVPVPAGLVVAPRPGLPVDGRFVTPDGDTYQFAALPVAVNTGRPRPEVGLFIVAQARPDWFTFWSDLGWRLMTASALALGAAVVLATLMARTLYRPIAQLTQASEAMACGHYEQRVPIEGPAELARLAASFNSMAAEADASRRTLRKFVSDASHELRTPLTVIRGFIEAMRDGTVHNAEGRDHSLAVIDNELRRLQRLVATLLDLSRIESGQASLRHDPVDVVGVARQCLEIVSHRAAEQDVDLRLEAPPSLPLVLGDADRLEQVIGNLLDNALRYTPTGGQVIVTLGAAGGDVTIVVSDTGAGIPREALPHVFQRFYTADPARSGRGAGLGLAIAREIALAHGGDIAVTSAPGQGSAFALRLPATAMSPSTGEVVAPVRG